MLKNKSSIPGLQGRFIEYVQHEKLFSLHDYLLIAVSGGLDSVVLCELLKQSGYHFEIAHCNFQLRGEESNRDEDFVRNLAIRHEVKLSVQKFNTNSYAAEHRLSIQEAARELRYQWFTAHVESREFNAEKGKSNPASGKSFIVTAHHRDDNIETSMMHFFKGTGVSGLRGMLPLRDNIARPLLFASRKEIQQYAYEHQLDWVEDSSNAETKYSRNFLRHVVIPEIEKIIPGFMDNLSDNLYRFRDAEMLYFQAIEFHRKKILEKKGHEWMIPVKKLRLAQPTATILYELIKPFGFTHGQAGEAFKLMDSETGKWIQSDSHRLLRNRNWLVISPLQSEEIQTVVIEDGNQLVAFANGTMKITALMPVKREVLSHDPFKVQLDADTVRYPLMLRKWKTGDYFYPLGMRKKKKLSRFFIDSKLSKNEKERIMVLESDKRIIWIPGYRIDDRFRITEGTKKILQLEFEIRLSDQ